MPSFKDNPNLGKGSRHSRIIPEAGDTLYLVPIRYWEPDEYAPEEFTLEHITDNGHFYGFHHEYGHNVYVKIDPCGWAWDEDSAKDIAKALTILKDAVSAADTNKIVQDIMDRKSERES